MVSFFDKGPKKAVFGSAFFGPLSKRRPFRPQFRKNNLWKHLWSQRGYSFDYLKPIFRSLGPLVSILRAFEWWCAGFRNTFFALCQKWRPFRPQFSENNFWEHLWSRRGYSRDYFKLNFRTLAPLVSILGVFEWRHAGFWNAFFGPLSK